MKTSASAPSFASRFRFNRSSSKSSEALKKLDIDLNQFTHPVQSHRMSRRHSVKAAKRKTSGGGGSGGTGSTNNPALEKDKEVAKKINYHWETLRKASLTASQKNIEIVEAEILNPITTTKLERKSSTGSNNATPTKSRQAKLQRTGSILEQAEAMSKPKDGITNTIAKNVSTSLTPKKEPANSEKTPTKPKIHKSGSILEQAEALTKSTEKKIKSSIAKSFSANFHFKEVDSAKIRPPKVKLRRGSTIMEQAEALNKPRDGITKHVVASVARKASLALSSDNANDSDIDDDDIEKEERIAKSRSYSAPDHEFSLCNQWLDKQQEGEPSFSLDEGIGLNSSFDSIPFADDDVSSTFDLTTISIPKSPKSPRGSFNFVLGASAVTPIRNPQQPKQRPSSLNVTAKSLKSPVATPVTPIITPVNSNGVKPSNDSAAETKRNRMQRLKSKEENISAWKNLTKQLVIAKKVLGEHEQKKQLKKMWATNYSGMCNRAVVLDSVVSEADKQGIKIKPVVTSSTSTLAETRGVDPVGVSGFRRKKNKNKYAGLGKKFYGFKGGKFALMTSDALAKAQVDAMPNTCGVVHLKSETSQFALNIRTRSVEVLLDNPGRKIRFAERKRASLHLQVDCQDEKIHESIAKKASTSKPPRPPPPKMAQLQSPEPEVVVVKPTSSQQPRKFSCNVNEFKIAGRQASIDTCQTLLTRSHSNEETESDEGGDYPTNPDQVEPEPEVFNPDYFSPRSDSPDHHRPVERAIEARSGSEDGLGSMVRCLHFAQTYIATRKLVYILSDYTSFFIHYL